MSETARLADQLKRAFDGEAWHGDSVLEILSGVDAATAKEAMELAAHKLPIHTKFVSRAESF